MTMIVCDVAKQRGLGLILGVGTLPSALVHLYVTNVTPTDASSAGSFVECTATSYSSLAILPANWTLSTVSDVATAVSPTLTFTISSNQTVYGYYITDSNNGDLLIGAELFANSIAYQAPSIYIDLTITVQLGDS